MSGRPVSTPIVKKGKVIGFYEGWIGDREFPIDMAGFAFSVKQLKEASKEDNVGMPYSNSDQENGFLQRLNVSIKDFQPLAKQCSEVRVQLWIGIFTSTNLLLKILVWHTRTVQPDESDFEPIDAEILKDTNLGPLSDFW